jgi:mono/diheme cytochrome c family protein
MYSRGILMMAMMAALTAACEVGESGESAAPVGTLAPFDTTLLAQMPTGTTIEMLTEGMRLFAVCSPCHGVDGRGTQLGPPLTGPEWVHTSGDVEQIEAVIRNGVATPAAYPIPMPPSGGGDFDETDLRALAHYVRSLGSRAR